MKYIFHKFVLGYNKKEWDYKIILRWGNPDKPALRTKGGRFCFRYAHVNALSLSTEGVNLGSWW